MAYKLQSETIIETVPPTVTSAETVDEVVSVSRRRKDFPVRHTFLQQRDKHGNPVPGPAQGLVRAGDRRALLLFLLLLTKASSAPWNAALPAPVWARALGLDSPELATARSTVSKIWLRLERAKLVRRERYERLADVFLLKEDGSAKKYIPPGSRGESHFKIPLALWLEGPDDQTRWYQVLSLPELLVMLIGRSLGDQFWIPFEKAPIWYGVSADTIARGVNSLTERSLLSVEKRFKKAPLSAVGYTSEQRYTLRAPFGPTGHISGSGMRRPKRSEKSSVGRRPVRRGTAGSKKPKVASSGK